MVNNIKIEVKYNNRKSGSNKRFGGGFTRLAVSHGKFVRSIL